MHIFFTFLRCITTGCRCYPAGIREPYPDFFRKGVGRLLEWLRFVEQEDRSQSHEAADGTLTRKPRYLW